MTAWRTTDADSVRKRIALACLRQQRSTDRVGRILLREHQREAAARLRESIQRCGGALLADEVGLGKTFTALAAAEGMVPLVVVAPATLADMWRGALGDACMTAHFVSFESLSRRDVRHVQPALVIVDEAHHARNPQTRRYTRLAALTRSSPVLLLSATPVHNAAHDLHALLALFLGARAARMTRAALSNCIVRRTRDDVRDVSLPHRAPPRWLEVAGAPDVLDAISAIPPACPPRDGGDGGALITLSLVRAWASTDAAVRATLLRRIARASALADALSTGRHPTRSELLAWVVGEDSTQLAFPELMVATLTGEWRSLSANVEQHVTGVRRALRVLTDVGDGVDDRRCAVIREIRARHQGERIVVFSQFADSVRAMFARLRGDGRVAAVTATGADVAGGPVTRAEVLARFAPRSTGRIGRVLRPAEDVTLLLATDLLSEGLNLQDASVVVHLDLPWTAARLTQRLGRVWRLGSAHGCVHEYAFAPPAPAEELLRLTRILTEKAGAASYAVGEAMAPLLVQRRNAFGTGVVQSDEALDPNSAHEALRRLLRGWAPEMPPLHAADLVEAETAPLTAVAGVRADCDGWIAAVTVAGSTQLIAAGCSAAPTTDPVAVLTLARAAGGRGCSVAPSRLDRALRAIEAHMNGQRAAQDAGLSLAASRAHASASSRIAAVAAAAPAHRRVVVSRLAATAREAVVASHTAGAERLLAALMARGPKGEPLGDDAEAWLSEVIELGAGAPNVADAVTTGDTFAIDALLLLVW